MARTTTEHSIVIELANLEGVVSLERLGSGTITPGHLLDITGAAVRSHATGDGVLPGKLVALENQTPDTQASPTTAAIDITYASGDTVYYAQGNPGDVFNMIVATSQTTVAGVSQLVSNGDGTLKVTTVDAATLVGAVVGVADEAVTSGTVVARCRTRIS